MGAEASGESGERLLQRAGSKGAWGRAGCPEQRLNSSENWFLQEASPVTGNPLFWGRFSLHRASGLSEDEVAIEVSEHLYGRLPGFSARGPAFSPLRAESLRAFRGTLQGLSPIWQFLQDAYTSSSSKIKEVTKCTMCQHIQQLPHAFPILLGALRSNTNAAAEMCFAK